MIPIERAEELLSGLLDELPEAFFAELNGGVSLLPDVKPDPQGDDLYILGEYCEDPFLGSSIVLYYGSFWEIFGDLPEWKLRRELRDTLRHEFRHHIESLAGEDALEVEDQEWMDAYMAEQQVRKAPEEAARAAYEEVRKKGRKFWRRG